MIKFILAFLLLIALPLNVLAAPSAKNAGPTFVTVNGDGTVLVSTNETSQWCVQRSNGGGCNIRITNLQNYLWSYATTGVPTTLDLTNLRPYCPCQAQFWEHAGQAHPYSALSNIFIP